MEQKWCQDELAGMNVGNVRVNRRTIQTISSFYSSIGKSIPEAMGSRSEVQACYRLLDNDVLTPEAILKPHYERTLERAKKHPVILLPSDTSSLDYTNTKSAEGLGILESKHRKGLLVHPTLAVTPDRVCLGLIGLKIWSRPEESLTSSETSWQRANRPFEKKESYRWLESFKMACKLSEQTPGTQFVSISDREGDIIDIYAEAIEERKKRPNTHLVARVNHDRQLDEGSDYSHLKKELYEAPHLGEIEFMIPSDSRTGRKARTVKQTIRAKEVTFSRKRVKENPIESVTLNGVIAVEENPPEGEEPVTWIFLTTLPIDTKELVILVLQYYLCRWEIEIFFRVLKSGCKVEERSLRTADRLMNLIAMLCIVTWRTLYAMMMGREFPDLSCLDIFDEAEWKAAWMVHNKGKLLPNTPPSLREFMIIIACLGGYLNRSNDPPPGPTVTWRGMQRVYCLAEAWECFGPGAVKNND